MVEPRMTLSSANTIADPNRPLGEPGRVGGPICAADHDLRAAASADQQLREPIRLDNELQADPELAEGPASGTRIAVFAVAFVVVIGTVFYAMYTPNPSSTAQSRSQPAASTGNATPGMTTGAAPASSQSAAVKSATAK